MNLPAWLQVQNELDRAMDTLPAKFPRPQSLIGPRTDVQVQKWRKLEKTRRDRIDAIVRDWIASQRWPDEIDVPNGYFVFLRLRAARDWIQIGCVGAVVDEDKEALLTQLLLDAWPECFLEQHLQEIEYRRTEYACGRGDAGEDLDKWMQGS